MFLENTSRAGCTAMALLMLGLGGCQTIAPVAQVRVVEVAQQQGGWQRGVQPDHIERLEGIDAAWSHALAAARAAGASGRLRAAGALLDPAAGQAWAMPSPGSYRCRRYRLAGEGRARGLAITGPFFCHLGGEGERLSLTQQTGPERPGGYLWEDGGRRMIFIGALSRGREDVPPAYGDAPERDVVGLFERVAPFRYRLVTPRSDGALEVLELVPVIPAF